MSIRKNTTYNLLGSIIPLAISLVTIPIYINLIGEARYGVLAIAWLLLGYFGLFDLGLGRATAQRIAALRSNSARERANSFWTALALNVSLGAIGAVLIWPVATYFFGNVLKIEDVLRPEIQASIPWLILAVPMATLSGVLSGALQGREQFLELNLISVLGTVLFQLLPLATAKFLSANLGLILPAALFARLVTLFVLFGRCQHHIFGGHAVNFDRAQAGQMLRFGGWVTVTSFIGPMMVVFDRFVIGAISGVKAVSYYTVPFQLGERSTLVSGALTSALFPRFASATTGEQQALAQRGLRLLIVVMTPLVAVGILFIESFLAWWLTPKFAQQSALVGQIIVVGFWFNTFATIPYVQLQAKGRPDVVAKCHIAELLPYFGLLYLGLNIFGLVGAAIAFTVRALIDFGLLAWLTGMLSWSMRLLLSPLLLLSIAFLLNARLVIGSIEWLILVFLYLLIIAIWAWQQSPSELRSIVLVRLTAS